MLLKIRLYSDQPVVAGYGSAAEVVWSHISLQFYALHITYISVAIT